MMVRLGRGGEGGGMVLDRTKEWRLGRGLPMDWKVFLPMRRLWPEVICLKNWRSSGMDQGRVLLMPITLFSEIATIPFIMRGGGGVLFFIRRWGL